MKTWIKYYTESNHDPKIGTLSWAQRGIWAALLALAGEIDDRDADDNETGRLCSIQDTAWRLRCSLDELQEAFQAFVDREMIEEQAGLWIICKYTKRQSRAPSAKHIAVSQRVKQHRNKQTELCNEDVTTLQKNVTRLKRRVTFPESDTESDTDTESRVINDSICKTDVLHSATPKVVEPIPRKEISLTPTQRQLTALWNVKRPNSTQLQLIEELTVAYGHAKVVEAAKWAHTENMQFGHALNSIKSALPKWGRNGHDRHDKTHNGLDRLSKRLPEYKIANPADFEPLPAQDNQGL